MYTTSRQRSDPSHNAILRVLLLDCANHASGGTFAKAKLQMRKPYPPAAGQRLLAGSKGPVRQTRSLQSRSVDQAGPGVAFCQGSRLFIDVQLQCNVLAMSPYMMRHPFRLCESNFTMLSLTRLFDFRYV